MAATTIGLTIFTAIPFAKFSGMVTDTRMIYKRRTCEIKQLVWWGLDRWNTPVWKTLLVPNLYSDYCYNEVRKCIGQWFHVSAWLWLNIIAVPVTLVKVIYGNNYIHSATGKSDGSSNENVNQSGNAYVNGHDKNDASGNSDSNCSGKGNGDAYDNAHKNSNKNGYGIGNDSPPPQRKSDI